MSHVKRLRRHVQPDHEFKHPMQTFNWSLLSRAVALGLRAYDAVTGNLYSLTDVMRYGSTSETRKQPKLRRSSKAKDVPVVLHFHGTVMYLFIYCCCCCCCSYYYLFICYYYHSDIFQVVAGFPCRASHIKCMYDIGHQQPAQWYKFIGP